MYKVFFNDRIVFLDDTLPDMSVVGKDYVCAFENITDLKPQIKQFLEPGKEGNLHIFHDNQESLFKTFSQCFTNIDAAGGLVRNDAGELLLIIRRGKWDLPKGKVEKGETFEETAVREVEEECGIKGVELGDYLDTTYHIYELEGRYVLKRTKWYNMYYGRSDEPSPLTSEDITEVNWIDHEGLDKICQNTFPSISKLIRGTT